MGDLEGDVSWSNNDDKLHLRRTLTESIGRLCRRADPCHVREMGSQLRYLTKHKIEL